MKINYLLFWILAMVLVANACKDDEETSPVESGKNTQRVKEITGHNDWWGDFRMECVYTKEKLDSALVWDMQGEKIAFLQAGYGKTISFSVYDIVTKESPEEIEEMDPADVTYLSQTLYSKSLTLDGEGRIAQISEVFYGPKDQTSGYNYQYEEKRSERDLYEYNAAGKVVNRRQSSPLHKEAFIYENGLLTEVVNYHYAQYDWEAEGTEKYQYEDGKLRQVLISAPEQETLTLTYTWENGQVREIRYAGGNAEDKTLTYRYDQAGFLTRVEESNGNWMEMKYEAGNGNFSFLVPYADVLKGIPFIQ